MSNLLLTGATGFLGRALSRKLKLKKYAFRESVRSSFRAQIDGVESFTVGEIGPSTNWSNALSGINCVIHCAAMVHVMHKAKQDALVAYRKVNVQGTLNLAEQAATAGVKRLVFLSSIKVNGEQTNGSIAFRHSDVPFPKDFYAISKWEAEQALKQVSSRTGMEIVIVRPPLIYGPGVKGNFLRLLNLVASGMPLPIGRVSNHRSLVGLDNLVDLIICCINHPAAAGQTFLASDGMDLSTPDLIKKLASAMGKSHPIFPVPVYLLNLVSRILGKTLEVDRLLDSLQVDSSRTCELLKWKPPLSIEAGLLKTVEWYLHSR